MLIVGAKGHAREIIKLGNSSENLYFFYNISEDVPEKFFGYPVLRKFREVEVLCKRDNTFCLVIGRTSQKFPFSKQFLELGGVLQLFEK